MVTMCKELDIVVTSEGIERREECDELVRAGCDLMQGYLFAKPGDAFPVPRSEALAPRLSSPSLYRPIER